MISAQQLEQGLNSYCANGFVESRYKEQISTGSNWVSTERAKTLAIEAKYSTNMGFSPMYGLSPHPLLFKNTQNDNLGSIP